MWLMVTALKEKAKKVVHFLTTELPMYFDRTAPKTCRETTDAFSVRTTRVENAPQIAHHNRENDTEPGRATGAISNHTKDPTTYVIMKSDRPVFTPNRLSSHHGWLLGRSTFHVDRISEQHRRRWRHLSRIHDVLHRIVLKNRQPQ